MSENKRFIGSSGGVYDQYKSDRFAWSEWEEIIQIMNNLNEKAIERSKALSKLQKVNEKLKSRNGNLLETLAFRSNQLVLLEELIDDLGSEEMVKQMGEILNG